MVWFQIYVECVRPDIDTIRAHDCHGYHFCNCPFSPLTTSHNDTRGTLLEQDKSQITELVIQGKKMCQSPWLQFRFNCQITSNLPPRSFVPMCPYQRGPEQRWHPYHWHRRIPAQTFPKTFILVLVDGKDTQCEKLHLLLCLIGGWKSPKRHCMHMCFHQSHALLRIRAQMLLETPFLFSPRTPGKS